MGNVKNTTRDNLIQFGKGLIDKAVNAVSPLLEPLDSLDDRVGVVENKFNEYQPLIDENNKVNLLTDNFVLYANYENLTPLTSANTTLYPIATQLKGNSISGIIFPNIKYYVFNESVATRIDTATNSNNQNIVLEGGLREYLLNYYPNNAVLTNKFATKESVTNVDTRVNNLKASLDTTNSNLTTINTNLKNKIANHSTRLDALEASSSSGPTTHELLLNLKNELYTGTSATDKMTNKYPIRVGDTVTIKNTAYTMKDESTFLGKNSTFIGCVVSVIEQTNYKIITIRVSTTKNGNVGTIANVQQFEFDMVFQANKGLTVLNRIYSCPLCHYYKKYSSTTFKRLEVQFEYSHRKFITGDTIVGFHNTSDFSDSPSFFEILGEDNTVEDKNTYIAKKTLNGTTTMVRLTTTDDYKNFSFAEI